MNYSTSLYYTTIKNYAKNNDNEIPISMTDYHKYEHYVTVLRTITSYAVTSFSNFLIVDNQCP